MRHSHNFNNKNNLWAILRCNQSTNINIKYDVLTANCENIRCRDKSENLYSLKILRKKRIGNCRQFFFLLFFIHWHLKYDKRAHVDMCAHVYVHAI